MTPHRRGNLSKPLHHMLSEVREIVEKNPDVKLIYPIHLNPQVKKAADEELDGEERIKSVEPLDVEEFHNLMANSFMVLTDSGGIQEDAPFLHKPVLVMRNTTERPEGIESGTLKLAGTSEGSIIQACQELSDNVNEYVQCKKSIRRWTCRRDNNGHSNTLF